MLRQIPELHANGGMLLNGSTAIRSLMMASEAPDGPLLVGASVVIDPKILRARRRGQL